MGRASRWIRSLLGVGTTKKPTSFENDGGDRSSSSSRRRWGFGKSFREKDRRVPPPRVAPPYAEEEREDSRRAIAVAAATAAVAEAAVAAAQAAAAVVRLTSGRGGRREQWAAVKIQSAFRAYLARRALRALRGLVKLQALVRGNIVRKQAAETLRCMQALVRVQARARACRALHADRAQRSISRTHPGPHTPEKYEQNVASKSQQRNSSKTQAQSSGWNWLDRWMEERYWDHSEPVKSPTTPLDDEKNAKILEVDPGKPHYTTRRKQSMPDSPSKDSTIAHRSIPSVSSVDMQTPSPINFPLITNADYSESPQFFSASSRPGSSRRGPFTPAKSECSRSLFSAYSDYPNYMANTEASRAKIRSQSAPKQRPEFEKSGSVRRMSGMSQKSSGSSAQAKFASKGYPGSGRLDRLGMPVRI